MKFKNSINHCLSLDLFKQHNVKPEEIKVDFETKRNVGAVSFIAERETPISVDISRIAVRELDYNDWFKSELEKHRDEIRKIINDPNRRKL